MGQAHAKLLEMCEDFPSFKGGRTLTVRSLKAGAVRIQYNIPFE